MSSNLPSSFLAKDMLTSSIASRNELLRDLLTVPEHRQLSTSRIKSRPAHGRTRFFMN